MEWFDWLQFNIFTLAPPECVGDYTFQLGFVATLPLIVMFTIILLSVLWAITRDALSGRSKLRSQSKAVTEILNGQDSKLSTVVSGLSIGTPPAVIIAFCVLPSVSSSLFATFDCERFATDDATGEAHFYLAKALSIRCSSGDYTNSQYDQSKMIAFLFMVIWPFGMPIATLLIMFYSHGAMLAKRATFWTRAFGFLHREYRPECCE